MPGIEQLPQELVTFLTRALDSDTEVELTAEMIATYLPEADGATPLAEPEQQQPMPEPQRPGAGGAQASAMATGSGEEAISNPAPDGAEVSVMDTEIAGTPRSEWVPRLEIAAIVFLTLLLVASMVALILLLIG